MPTQSGRSWHGGQWAPERALDLVEQHVCNEQVGERIVTIDVVADPDKLRRLTEDSPTETAASQGHQVL